MVFLGLVVLVGFYGSKWIVDLNKEDFDGTVVGLWLADGVGYGKLGRERGLVGVFIFKGSKVFLDSSCFIERFSYWKVISV